VKYFILQKVASPCLDKLLGFVPTKEFFWSRTRMFLATAPQTGLATVEKILAPLTDDASGGGEEEISISSEVCRDTCLTFTSGSGELVLKRERAGSSMRVLLVGGIVIYV
jgi:hypothetical protein